MNRFRLLLIIAVLALIEITPGEAASMTGEEFHDRIIARIRVLSDSPNVRLLRFGRSGKGLQIPAFVISDFSKDAKGKARIFICAGQHGDERAPVESAVWFSEGLASNIRPDLLARCAFVVIPMVNPDGIAASRRTNARGLDINRDWIALASVEARFVHEAIKAWKPHLLMDVHEWIGPSLVPGNEIEVASCRSYSQKVAVTCLARRAERVSGLTLVQCGPASDARLFHRRYSLFGYAAYLLETAPGQNIETKHRAYASAITAMAKSVAIDADLRTLVSPASTSFDLSTVSAYIEPLPGPDRTAAAWSAFGTAAMLMAGYCLLMWLAKPFARGDASNWSRRFRKCEIEEIDASRLSIGRFLPPITQRSQVHRRMRAKRPTSRLGCVPNL